LKLYTGRIFSFIYLLLASHFANASILLGKVTDERGVPLSFATISVSSLKKASMSNEKGEYNINVEKGVFSISCQHIGYKISTVNLKIDNDTIRLDFKLIPTILVLDEIIVRKGKEDPAFEIIRNAISKRTYHQSQVESYSCQAYIKGLIRTVDYPSSIFGQRIDFEDGDTSKRKIIFLSESISDIYFKQPRDYRINVVSTRVSGQSNGLGLATPLFISFYENSVNLPRSFNPRGFVSPIADGAFRFYDFKYLGAFSESGQLVNRIQVMPKRLWEPLFSGFIEIVENTWNIHAVDLVLTKTSQLEFADKIRIVQLYKPVSGNTWLLNSQTIFPEVNILGFKATGNFSTVFENYDLNFQPNDKLFGNTIIKYDVLSNQRPDSFWSYKRPIPLLQDEVTDFKKKDSLERLKNNPAYLDSLDKIQNRPTFLGITLNGQTLQKRSRNFSFTYDPLLKSVGFNTVEGLSLQLSGTAEKEFKDKRSLSLTPVLRYGTINKHLTGFISGNMLINPKNRQRIGLAMGKKVFQFNNANPIPQVMNTFSTLLGGNNYLKIYEANYFQVNYSRRLTGIIAVIFHFSFQDRKPLNNTTGAGQWGTFKSVNQIEPNYPTEISNSPLLRHQAAEAGIKIQFRTGAKFIELPDGSINSFSKSPVIDFHYNKGLKRFLSSDVNYDKWKLSVKGKFDFKLLGEFRYNLVTAGFLNARNVQLPDFHHYAGNLTRKAAPYLESFQLAPFYAFSNNAELFSALHFEYRLNGLGTNKIPVLRNLNFRLITGTNILLLKGKNYQEVFLGVDNVAKLFRIDFVKGLGKDGSDFQGIKIGIRGFSSLFSDY
jgi:hypothetical protein